VYNIVFKKTKSIILQIYPLSPKKYVPFWVFRKATTIYSNMTTTKLRFTLTFTPWCIKFIERAHLIPFRGI